MIEVLHRSPDGTPGICGIDKLPSAPFGAYLSVNDTSAYGNESEVEREVFDWLRTRLSIFREWFERQWKVLAAMLSTCLLIFSAVMLMISVYIDEVIRRRRLRFHSLEMT